MTIDLLKQLIDSFGPQNLATFFRSASGRFRPVKEELLDYLPFVRTLLKDLRDYRTLSEYALRRLASVDLKKNDRKALSGFIEELNFVKNHFGEDYLEIIEQRQGSMESEIIIAIENQIFE